MTLDLTGKHCPVIFSGVLVFVLEKFLEPALAAMRTSVILLFGKTKAFFGKDTARIKKNCILHTLFPENERETSKLK